MQLACRPAGSRARAGGAAQISGARSFPVFHVDIRLYAIGQTDVCRTRKSDGDHDYVGLAQARPNYIIYIIRKEPARARSHHMRSMKLIGWVMVYAPLEGR